VQLATLVLGRTPEELEEELGVQAPSAEALDRVRAEYPYMTGVH
jgi:hypothetical protein